MLLNKQGKAVHVPHINPRNHEREAVLAPLFEILEPESLKCHGTFSLKNRARFIE